MAPETRTTQRKTQEQSIKARKNELFEEEARNEEEGRGLRRPFRAYLHETPAAPLSLGVKASLWGTGAVVGFLLVAALAGGHGTRAKVPTFSVVPVTPRTPIVTSSLPPTAARAPALTPTPGPDKKAEKKDKKNAPKSVVIAEKSPKPEPPKPEGPKPVTTVRAGTPKPENPTPAPAPAPATVATPAPTPTPMPGIAANNATTTAKPGPAAPAEAPKTVQVNPQPALGAATSTNNAEATPKEQVKPKKSSIFKKKKPPVFTYPKREPRPDRKEPLPDLSDLDPVKFGSPSRRPPS